MTRRLVLIILLLAAKGVWAEPPPDVVNLETVLNLAREASPRLAIERQGIAVAKAERVKAGAMPNPTINYGQLHQFGRQTQFEGRWAQGVSVELPLLLGGQRGARVKAADKGIEAAQAQVVASSNNLAADAGAAYVALLLAQEKRGVLTASLTELGQMRAIVAGRQTSGMASQYDLLRMDVELESWRTRTAVAAKDLTNRQGELAILLGFQGWRPVSAGELHALDVRPEPAPLDANPAIIAARRDEAAAQAGVEVARRERFPNVSVYAGRSATMDLYGALDSIGVAVEIPIFDTRRGALDKAHAEAQTAGLRTRLVEAGVQSDVERYSAQVVQLTAALEQFRQRMGLRLPAMKQMAEDAYRLGKGTIIELLDAARTRYETQISQLELIASLMEAQLRLKAARGELISATDK
jgi:cobalt-zinc-cadmium efflux system outer membrane protein